MELLQTLLEALRNLPKGISSPARQKAEELARKERFNFDKMLSQKGTPPLIQMRKGTAIVLINNKGDIVQKGTSVKGFKFKK